MVPLHCIVELSATVILAEDGEADKPIRPRTDSRRTVTDAPVSGSTEQGNCWPLAVMVMVACGVPLLKSARFTRLIEFT